MTVSEASSPSAAGYDLDGRWPWVPVDREAVRVLNRRGRAAVVFCQLRVGDASDAPLAKILDALPAGFPADRVVSVGRVRTLKEGVERLVRNVVANPHIDTLILVGRDSKVFRPLRGIDCLFRYGTDDAGRILAPDQDEPTRRVFARDALVTVTAAEIDYFRRRAGLRVIAELIDGPATAAEALSAAAEIVGSLPPRSSPPCWDFLTELDVGSWGAEKTVEAAEPYEVPADRSGPTVRGDAEFVCAEAGGWRARIGRGVNLASEKLLHTWLRDLRAAGTTPTELETAEAAMRFEAALSGAGGRGGSAQTPTSPSSGLRPPSPSRGEGVFPDAVLTPFDDDPAGWFVTRVEHESGRLFTDVYQNAVPGDPATARQVATVVGEDPRAVLRLLLEKDWFGRHAQRLEHIGYVAIMLARAAHAARTGYGFTQDKPLDTSDDVRRNVDWKLNAAVVLRGGTLDEVWKRAVRNLAENGLITRTQKGRVVENWCTLLHVADMAAMTIPEGYPATEENISAYAEEFFSKRPEGSDEEYTYGDRMCHHYGHDQVQDLIRRLRERPDLAHPSQRYDPWTDLGRSHIPCLAFDVWFLWNGRLHTVQITRAHDIYGAMPQNALGVARGWAKRIADGLGVERGDLVFLSTSNNYRVADDGEAVARVLETPDPGHGFESDLDVRVASREPWAFEPYVPISAVFREQTPDDADLDSALMAATLAAETEIGRRLRTHRGFDQIRAFADHLNAALRKNPHYRTQYGLLSPRDPWLDRDAEATDLLSLQLRNQLGRLHAAAVFVNSPADLRTQLSIVAAVQREAARLTDHPPGSVYLLNVLPQTAPEEPR
jgi:hypothetical protein